MVPHRSTKGASKARRDHINHEIRNLRALLPVGRDDQERLSYLHSMAAVCTFIRKSVRLQGLSSAADRSNFSAPPYESLLPTLHGFILVTTAEGKLVYVSENVDEYLGFSMLDVLQGDTFFDMVEQCDVDVVKSNLDFKNNSSSERSFVCRMQTSKSFRLQHSGCCSMLVRGSFRSFPGPHPSPSSQPLFVALCTPTVDRLQGSDSGFCLSFSSVHRPDMSFMELSESVSCFLGFSPEELVSQSWYSLVHPEDLSACAASHRSLIHADEGSRVEMVLRLQSKDLSWTWIYTQANKPSETQGVSCTNFIVCETEARFLQEKISGEAFKLSPQTQSGGKCLKRRRTSDSQSEEQSARARRESDRDVNFVSSPAPSGDSPALFTPPYSPAPSASSSCSALQHEELGCNLLMEVQGYADQLMSSPECSFSSPSAVLPGQSFEAAAFIALTPPSSSSSSPPGFETSDVRLVPDCLSLTDMCESSTDCALHQDDFTLLEQQGGSTEHVHHVPRPLTFSPLAPTQPPPSSACDYSERERAEISILAQQISSLANSFAASSSLNPLHNVVQPTPTTTWPPHPPPLPPRPLKHEDDLHDCMFESILKDLHMVKSAVCSQLEDELLDVSLTLAETLVDPFSLQLGRPDTNTELHQLNHYMQRILQQDALAEENLY